MQPEEMMKMPKEISDLMTDKMGIRGKTLAPKLRRAGRLLPKQVRNAAEILADAELHLQSPKMMKRVDSVALTQAYYLCKVHLEGTNSSETRANKRGDMLGSIAFNMLFLFIIVIAFVLWKGLI